MNCACRRRAPGVRVAPGYLSPFMAQVAVTTRHHDPTCRASIAGGAHHVCIANQHDSIQAIDADDVTVLRGAMASRKSP